MKTNQGGLEAAGVFASKEDFSEGTSVWESKKQEESSHWMLLDILQ